MNRERFIRDCITTTVADDYENFALILKWVRRLARLRNISVNKAQVVAGLRGAIDEGYVAAFEFSPTARKVDYSYDRLEELWFYATAKGKRSAKGIPKLSGGKL